MRERACGILAYSLRADMIPILQAVAASTDAKTRVEAEAAIDAITNQNHHYFLDRKHTGQSFWVVRPSDRSSFGVGG